MAVTQSKAAKAAMAAAVDRACGPAKTHKVIAYIGCASGLKAVVVDAHDGDDIRRIVMEREQGKHGGGVVYLAHESQEDALFARSAMQGAARDDFIRHRVSMLQTQAAPPKKEVRYLKVAATGNALFDSLEESVKASALKAYNSGMDYFEAVIDEGVMTRHRFYLRELFPNPAKVVERPHRQEVKGQWLDPSILREMEDAAYDIKPTGTPFMDLAMKTEKMTRKQAEGLYGTSMAQFAQQAMRGADFERKLEQVRKDQEELCGVKVSLDPAVGCDDFVISTGRRAGKTSGLAAMIADAQRTATKSTEQMLVDAMQKLWGGTPVATVHDEVQVAQDPSAARDAAAMARGTAKPQNKPHRDEKPANPYPPAHPKAEAPAGLMAVAPMDFRMGNRWMP